MGSFDADGSLIPEEVLQKATEAVHNWLTLYTLPANYTLDREFNESVAEANSESLARAALQAMLGTLIIPEWGIFRKTDPTDVTPIENRIYRTKAAAEQYLEHGYNNVHFWEVRGRTVGEWVKS